MCDVEEFSYLDLSHLDKEEEMLNEYFEEVDRLRPYKLYVELVRDRTIERIDKVEKARRYSQDNDERRRFWDQITKYSVTKNDYSIAANLLNETWDQVRSNKKLYVDRPALKDGMIKIRHEIQRYFFGMDQQL